MGVAADEPYDVGPLTVTGVLSTRVGEGDLAPTATNVYAPMFELMLSPGACAEGTCR